MLAFESRSLAPLDSPRHNPCAQCGKPIAAPEWVEEGSQSRSYLWHCKACGYKFEAMAFFKPAARNPVSLAA